jgi:hypothetical protein
VPKPASCFVPPCCLLPAHSLSGSCLLPALLPAPTLLPRHINRRRCHFLVTAAPCRDYSALEAAHGAGAKPLEVLVGATNRLGQLLSEDQQEALRQVGGWLGGWMAGWVAGLPLPSCPCQLVGLHFVRHI